MNFKLSSNEGVIVVMSTTEEPESSSSRSKDAEEQSLNDKVDDRAENLDAWEMDTPKAFVDDTCPDVAKKYCPVITTGGFEELGTLKTFDGNGLFSHNFEAAIKFRNTKENDSDIWSERYWRHIRYKERLQ